MVNYNELKEQAVILKRELANLAKKPSPTIGDFEHYKKVETDLKHMRKIILDIQIRFKMPFEVI